MRDIITIPISSEACLIMASDNSGGIGMKQQDLVQVPYEKVAYFSFRVAVMECIAAGGKPVCVILQNFCGNEPWTDLVSGIKKGLKELDLNDVLITGSTESNFHLQQSAVGLIVVGTKTVKKTPELLFKNQLKIACIGKPLVGNEVIEFTENIAPLSLFSQLNSLKDVILWPVGSKGILYEMNQMFSNKSFSKEMVITSIDVLKSSGPATCFIVVFHETQEVKIKKLAGGFFHPVQIAE